jgi:hypothetical protein
MTQGLGSCRARTGWRFELTHFPRCRVLLGNHRSDHTPNIVYATGTQPHCPVQHSLPVTTAHAPLELGATIFDSSRPHFRFQPSIPSALPSITGSWNITIHPSGDSHWTPPHLTLSCHPPVQSGLRTSELLHTRSASLAQSHPKVDRGNDPSDLSPMRFQVVDVQSIDSR